MLAHVQTRDGQDTTTLVRSSQARFVVATPRSWLEIASDYILHGIQHIFVWHGPFAVRARVGFDRERSLDAVENCDRLHRRPQHHAGHRDARLRRGARGAAQCCYRPEHSFSRCRRLSAVGAARPASRSGIHGSWPLLFGLIHGFGFAGALTSAGLPHKDLPLALLSFNVGVEIGQVSFVLLILLLERSFRQLEIRWPRWVQALPGYTVGSLGAFWTIQRAAMLLGITP